MIKDSGNRTEFETVAVRDIWEGKDGSLLPLLRNKVNRGEKNDKFICGFKKVKSLD